MMRIFTYIKYKGIQVCKSNKEIIINIVEAFGVRGTSMVLSLFTMPAYIRYFHNQSVLGIWYTLLSVLNWVLMFDLGVGNGLRNKLPICLVQKDYNKAKSYIASTYVTTLFLVLAWCILGYNLIPLVNWNSMLNVNTQLVSNKTMIGSIRIVFFGIMVQFILKLITSILYAIQRSAIVNLLTLLSTSIILLLVNIAPVGTTEQNLVHMSWINALAVNVPLLMATVIVFSTTLKKVIPRIRDITLKCAKEVLNIGLTLLWLQLIFMVISNTNEFLISHITNSAAVVQYQAYNKILNTICSLFTLALTPIWSAVTKAAAAKRYKWIKKLNIILLLSSLVVLACELMAVPFMQWAVNIWLGEGIVTILPAYAILFAVSNTIFYVHNVNTSFGNGMSIFKIQLIWVTVAAIVDIPLAYLFVHITGSWIGVIIANVIALIPFELFEIIY